MSANDSSSKPSSAKKSREWRQLVAGGASGAITKTAIAPLERVKILFQIQGMRTGPNKPKPYTGILSTIFRVIREEGFLALYKGNGANVVRIIPNYALKFSFNDTIRQLVARPGQSVKDLSFAQLMMSGTGAGLVQISCTYPLELVRTRLTLASHLADGVQYKGIMDCFTRTVREEGATALFKGIVPTFISGIPYVGLQMTFYELFQRILIPYYEVVSTPDGVSILGLVSKLAAGALAGICAQSITYPGDTIRRRLQTNGIGGTKAVYSGTWDCVKQIVAKEGVVGFYRGIGANVVRCIPGAAIQFLAYDSFKQILGL